VSLLKGTVVFRFNSPVYFATVIHFKKQLFASTVSLTELNARQRLANKQRNGIPDIEIVDGKASAETSRDGIGKAVGLSGAEENVKSKDQSEGLPDGHNNGESALIKDTKDGIVIKHDDVCNIKVIIVECSYIPFVDTAGSIMLAHIHNEYNKHGVKLVLAGCCDTVVSTLKRVEQCQTLCRESVYPSVQSAVLSLHCDTM